MSFGLKSLALASAFGVALVVSGCNTEEAPPASPAPGAGAPAAPAPGAEEKPADADAPAAPEAAPAASTKAE